MNEPERQPHGRLVQQPGGHEAFIPDPLPPPFAWDSEIVTALSAADLAIGRLGGEGRRLPNPHVLIRPFVRREAVLSSRIEGTVSGLGDLLAAEAGARVRRNAADLHEVANYVTALEHAVERLGTLPLSLRLVREAHRLLMTDVRGNAATPGEFRRTQNWIGAPGSTPSTATYVPPPADALADCLKDWERFLHDRTLPALVHAGLAHAQFEAIHPFLDGNGRVGRLVVTLLLIERDVLPAPLLYLSAWFEATRSEYYARLLGTTEAGEWKEWLVYFLRGVAVEAEDATRRIREIDALMTKWRKLLGGEKSRMPETLLELFVGEPVLDDDTDRQAARRRVHDGKSGRRPAPGRGHRRTRRRRAAEPPVLRRGHADAARERRSGDRNPLIHDRASRRTECPFAGLYRPNRLL